MWWLALHVVGTYFNPHDPLPFFLNHCNPFVFSVLEMAPIRHTKYNYSEKTLSKTSKCQICGKLFKPQGIKSHATHCAACQTREIQQIDATKEYEREKEQAEELRVALVTSAYSTVRMHITQAGPSQAAHMLSEDNNGLPRHVGASWRSCCTKCNTPSLFQSQEEFGQHATAMMAPNPHPWCPFIEEGDYLFAEIALQAGLNASQINGLLSLISRIVQGKANVTLQNNADLQHAWDRVAMQVTPVHSFSSYTMSFHAFIHKLLL
ncbi:hypothetical protein F5J12DRAFT_787264 [Pisolithus orientalis]|uniref:uncharacterized protein n=1 Tax=Pisolithus orientalis TaxID=936130 RepID=UPI002224C3A2|nr:uncharacterized protein F5J12DRAFT_787264 [Pisolithus orientalis]KAI5986273.1 hypothetical protein F5J12DRAFT_787264 [Pisolithus orientalis]